MTTNQDALEKIRHQIRVAEKYQKDNPDFDTPGIVLDVLKDREYKLANLIQAEILKEGIEEAGQGFAGEGK